MRLSLSLGLWLTGLSVLVLGVHGASQLADEERDLQAAVARELALVATAVRSAVENAVRDDQEADIGALLAQLELRDPAFDVFVFRGEADLLGSSWGSATNLPRARELAAHHRGGEAQRITQLDGGNVAVVSPFRSSAQVPGQIVILRPPNALRADLRDERNAVFFSLALLAVTLTTCVWLVLNLRLQRPISQMVGVLQRVAAGDLKARIGRRGSDELALLAREFDAMIASLERTRSELATEAETREKLEGEMLRANRLAIVGELAATLAHEVGSPLQVLGGRAQDIADRDDLPADVQRSARIVVEQVHRVDRIVDRFLDVARRKTPVLEDVGLGRAVQQVTELLGSQARREGVRFEIRVPPDHVVRADPAQLQQVLLNLVQNAIRASPRGGAVTIGAAPSSFQRVADGPPQPSVALEVADEGPGIPEGAAEHLFQPFFTDWGDAPRPGTGTGLGLSVVRSILHDHGGVVRVDERRHDSGARFVAHFPSPGGEIQGSAPPLPGATP